MEKSAPQFPAHLVYHVLGFLKYRSRNSKPTDDQRWKADLRACSFVSKIWRKLALDHLFYNFSFSFEGSDPLFDDSDDFYVQDPDAMVIDFDASKTKLELTTKKPKRTRTLLQLSKFLRRSSFGSIIQHLTLTQTTPTDRYDEYVDPTAICLLLTLKSLPRLCTLALHDVCLNATFETSAQIFQDFGNVPLDRLTITYSQRAVRPSCLMHILSCFGTVAKLHLGPFDVDTKTQDAPTLDPPHLYVTTLSLHNVHPFTGLLSALGATPFTRHVSVLHIAGLSLYDVRTHNIFLGTLGRTLESYTVNFDSSRADFWRPFVFPLSLARCGPRLETVTFQASIREGQRVAANARNGAAVRSMNLSVQSLMRRRVPSPHTIALEFLAAVRLSRALKHDESALEELSDRLLELSRHGLKRVNITLYTQGMRENRAAKDEKFLTRVFKRLLVAGDVDVHFRCIDARP